MALFPTKKITQLAAFVAPLTGTEELEAVQLGNSVQVPTRAFVLPTDSLLTVSGMGGSIPGSRQLVSSPTVQVVDGGPAGQLSLTAISAVGAPTGLQVFVALAGNNNNVALTNGNIGFLDVNTAAGAADITGIVAPFDGFIITVTNTDANLLRLMPQDANSAAANRFRLPANIALVQNSSYTLRYCLALTRWVPYS